jgi:hypothetical protein
MENKDESFTFYFECGCFYSVFITPNGALMSGLACCLKHEAPYQQLENILPLTLVRTKVEPRQLVKTIIVNGDEIEYVSDTLTYENAICLAGWSPERILSVTVKARGMDGKILSPGRVVPVSEGTVINVADTSGA